MNTKDMSYSEWNRLLELSMEKGMESDEFKSLKANYPLSSGESYNYRIIKDLAKLTEIFLKRGFTGFEKGFNIALAENDAEGVNIALKRLKKICGECFFFEKYDALSAEYKYELSGSIHDNILKFEENLVNNIKTILYENDSALMEEILYLVKKTKISRYVKYSK